MSLFLSETVYEGKPNLTPAQFEVRVRQKKCELLRLRTAEAVYGLISGIQDTDVQSQLVFSLSRDRMSPQKRDRLIAAMVSILKNNPRLATIRSALLAVSNLVQNSFIESVAENSTIPTLFDDEPERRYIEGFKKRGGDGFVRASKQGNYFPCSAMEEYYDEAWRVGACAVLVQRDPKTVWLYKHHGDHMEIMTNLATGEAYLPGSDVREDLNARIDRVRNPVFDFKDFCRAVHQYEPRLHFTRLVYPEQCPRGFQFHNLRAKLLEQFLV